jgi:hypothetical protein
MTGSSTVEHFVVAHRTHCALAMKWLIIGLCSAACGWSLSLALELALQQPPRPSAPRATKPVPRASPTLARLGPVLGLLEHPTTPDVVVATPTPSLLGTLWPGLATFFDETDHRVHTAALGDFVHDTELVSIEHGAVTVRHQGRLVRLDSRRPALTASVATPPRSQVVEQLFAQVTRELQVVPAFTDGQLRGFRLARVTPDSFVSRAGLVAGDTVKRINGVELSNPENLARLLLLASTAATAELDLDRSGQSVHLSVPLR